MAQEDTSMTTMIRIFSVTLLLLLPVSGQAVSTVKTKVGSGTGSIIPATSVIATGANQDSIISASSGTIGYVTLDDSIITVFKVGGIGKTSAIVTVPENAKQRILVVYFIHQDP